MHGLKDAEIARLTDIPRGTIKDWRQQEFRESPFFELSFYRCPICSDSRLEEPWYAYLLGLYLGDGCLADCPKNVKRLRVVLDNAYPNIVFECAVAMNAVRPGGATPGVVRKEGCVEVNSYWKHWIYLFPQHGPGKKHERKIQLADWQERIVGDHTDRFLRGLIHSDGDRHMNKVRIKGKVYSYPRYSFSNLSTDILALFAHACELYGIRWTQMNYKTITVARSEDVAKLDLVIGPKE